MLLDEDLGGPGTKTNVSDLNRQHNIEDISKCHGDTLFPGRI